MAGHGRYAPVRYHENQEKFGGNPWSKGVLAVPAWGAAGKIARAGVIAALAALTCIATGEFLVDNLTYLSCLFGRSSCHINIKTWSTTSKAKMRAHPCAQRPISQLRGPAAPLSSLRRYAPTVATSTPPEGLRPSHRAYSAAAPSPIKQLSTHRDRSRHPFGSPWILMELNRARFHAFIAGRIALP